MSNSNLRPDDIDRLGKALLTLASEVWALRDRQRLLEAALAEAGVRLPVPLDEFQPDAGLQAELAADREAFIGSLIQALRGTER